MVVVQSVRYSIGVQQGHFLPAPNCQDRGGLVKNTMRRVSEDNLIVDLTVPVALPGYYGELTVKKISMCSDSVGKKKIFHFINIHKNMDVFNLQTITQL